CFTQSRIATQPLRTAFNPSVPLAGSKPAPGAPASSLDSGNPGPGLVPPEDGSSRHIRRSLAIGAASPCPSVNAVQTVAKYFGLTWLSAAISSSVALGLPSAPRCWYFHAARK